MSRRKQEKPQPRKSFVKGGCDVVLCSVDILTCGVCRKNFPLGDIVRFIQHKVQLCNKENHRDDEEEEDNSGEEGEEDPPALLTVLRKEDDEDLKDQVSSSSVVKMAIASAKEAATSANTPHEPSNYVCSTCKQSLSTAWALIQHAQAAHGLSICASSTSEDSQKEGLRVPLLERQAPLFAHSSQDLLKSSTPPPPPLLLEPPNPAPLQDSSYSQRLRVLAGATSPNNNNNTLLQTHLMLNKSSPSRNSSPEQSTTAQLNSDSPASSTEAGDHQSNGGKSGGNGLECEYCHKSFPFPSNLVVHRRSHTGEKPYKCHVCAHACTQASKLKRHMKTHRTGGTSPPSSDESRKQRVNGECRSDEEEDEEVNVDEEEEERSTSENGNLVIVQYEDEEEEDMVAEDLTQKKSTVNGVEENGGIDDRRSLVPKNHHSSIIGEIMIGLGRIPPYDEAYKQALKESSASSFHHRGAAFRNHQIVDRCSSGTEASNDASHHSGYDAFPASRSAGQSPLGFGSAFHDSSSLDSKRIRLDNNHYHDQDGGYLYAGVWFPSIETPTPAHTRGGDLYGSGIDGSKSESALNGGPGPSAQHKPNKEGGGPRRNDTCEFCGKVFKNCSNLTVHRRSHTGEKPYKCGLCSYACAQSSKLTRHMKTHGRLGKDVYRCRFCDMPFSVASTLEKHMRKCVVSSSQGSSSPTHSYHHHHLASDDLKEITAA